MTELHVRVDQMPEPGLLRPAIEAALAGRAWPDGPEATVARAVAHAAAPHAAAPDAGTTDAGAGPLEASGSC